MKKFWKIFIVCFILFAVAFSLGSYSYIRIEEEKANPNIGGAEYKEEILEEKKQKPKNVKEYNSLEDAIKNSSRVNVLVVGMEDSRTDSIIFGSFDPDNKKVNMISIPRDTYIHRKGYDSPQQRKINAIYGVHGIEGVKESVSHILEGVPIHHHVILDYDGVEAIIDSIDGVEVVVPFHMKYSDPSSKPPLNIDIKEGKQTLSGKESLGFLRYRKGDNDVGYIDGDLGRIKAQQEFLKSFTNKVLTYRLPKVIKNGFEYVETDIKILQGLSYSKNAIGIKSEDFSFTTLPGEGEFKKINGKLPSYFIYDSLQIKEMLDNMYKVKKTP